MICTFCDKPAVFQDGDLKLWYCELHLVGLETTLASEGYTIEGENIQDGEDD